MSESGRRTLPAVLFGLAMLAIATQAFGQDSVKWLVGTWRGTNPSPAGQGATDQSEWVFKEDGTYRLEVQSARAGVVNRAGVPD